MRTTFMRASLSLAAVSILAACGTDPSGGLPDVECDAFLTTYQAVVPGDTIASNGIKYLEVEEGTTGQAAAVGQTIDVNYSGYLTSGTRFDSSCLSGAPILRFTVGSQQLIPGFDLGVRGMLPGGVRRVIVPPELGYGNVPNGPIPANSTLIFDIEYLGVAN